MTDWIPMPEIPKKKHYCESEFISLKNPDSNSLVKCVDNRSHGLTLIWHDETVWPVS